VVADWSNDAKERANEALLKIMETPYAGKGLTGNLKGMWSFRIGKHRILYEINDISNEVFILAVGLRKNIYDFL